MRKIVFLDHTADVMYDASGATLEEAVENAASALFSVTAHLEKVKGKRKSVKIAEKAETLEELVAFSLNDLVAESDARELFFKKFKVKKIKQEQGVWQLKGVASGYPFTPKAGNTHVKSVTHHATEVRKEKGKWKVRILLDI